MEIKPMKYIFMPWWWHIHMHKYNTCEQDKATNTVFHRFAVWIFSLFPTWKLFVGLKTHTYTVRLRELVSFTRDMYGLPLQITQRTKEPTEIAVGSASLSHLIKILRCRYFNKSLVFRHYFITFHCFNALTFVGINPNRASSQRKKLRRDRCQKTPSQRESRENRAICKQLRNDIPYSH